MKYGKNGRGDDDAQHRFVASADGGQDPAPGQGLFGRALDHPPHKNHQYAPNSRQTLLPRLPRLNVDVA